MIEEGEVFLHMQWRSVGISQGKPMYDHYLDGKQRYRKGLSTSTYTRQPTTRRNVHNILFSFSLIYAIRPHDMLQISYSYLGSRFLFTLEIYCLNCDKDGTMKRGCLTFSSHSFIFIRKTKLIFYCWNIIKNSYYCQYARRLH